MTLSFPNNPQVGDVYQSWFWTGEVWKASSGSGGGGANIISQETAPSNPAFGDLWFNTELGILLVYYSDGTSNQWVDVSTSSTTTGASGASVTVQDTPPGSATEGDLWFDAIGGTLYIFTESVWVDTSAGSTGSTDAATVIYTPAGTGAVATDVETKLRESVSVKDFGAVGDGVTDDTAAIQAAIDYVESIGGGTVYLPAGTFITSSTLTIDASKVAIVGAGAYQTTISGNFAAGDIIYSDGTTSEVKNLYFSQFRVTSSVLKTSGAGIHLYRTVRSHLNNIIMDGQDGSGNLYHGFWFDSVDAVSLTTFEVKAQQDGVRVNGAVGSNPKADLMLDTGKIAGCNIGLHCGGAFGGLYGGNKVSLINNANNFRLSQDIVAEANREVFFTGTIFDATSSGAGIVLDDAGNCKIIFSGVWVASASTYGIHIVQGNPNIVFDGRVFNCGTAGLHVAAGNPIVSVGVSDWRDNNNADITSSVAFNLFLSESAILAQNNRYVDWTIIPPQLGQSFDVVLDDDTATSFTPAISTGLAYMENQDSPRYALFRYAATASPSAIDISSTTGAVVVTTGALTGTTGTDARITVASHTDGKIYLENRLGSTQRIRMSIQ